MIAANSPLNSATPVHAANPTRNYRSCEARCPTSNLGFSSSVCRLWVNPTRMDLLHRIVGAGCFRDPRRQGLKVEIESGGEDVFAVNANGAVPEHLVIMVNGIIGSASDWRYAADQFVKKLPDKVIVHRISCCQNEV